MISVNKKIIGLMATDPNGLIGNNDQLPWNYPNETEHFKSTIIGNPIILGYKTYCSMPQDFFQKHNNHIIILSKKKDIIISNGHIVNSIDESIDMLKKISYYNAFMIGGAEIAKLFLKYNLLDMFILTKIKKCYSGNVYLDLKIFESWHCIDIEYHDEYNIHYLIPNLRISLN